MLRRLTMGTALAAAMSIAAVVTLASPALAKGPIQARITGPGLAHAIVVGGNGEPGLPGRLETLASQTGLFAVMFGANGIPAPARLPAPPTAATLGPGYALGYTVPGVTPRRGQRYGQIHQTLYPWAAGGPVIYTPPGQQGFGQPVVIAGRFRGHPPLTRLLAQIGVPPLSRAQAARRAALQSASSAAPAWLIASAAVLAAAAFLGAVLWLRRRKPATVLAPGLPRRQH